MRGGMTTLINIQEYLIILIVFFINTIIFLLLVIFKLIIITFSILSGVTCHVYCVRCPRYLLFFSLHINTVLNMLCSYNRTKVMMGSALTTYKSTNLPMVNKQAIVVLCKVTHFVTMI